MEAARIAADIADALEFAHRNGVVHRDVKPGNVLITPEGGVKVTDFGIARAESSDTLTKTGAVLGTATYFSPEQAQGLALDGRSDVYALGVVLYEMLTGVAPFTADSPVSVAYKHVREEPVPPTRIKPGIPGALDRIVLTAMTKDVDAALPVRGRAARRPPALRARPPAGRWAAAGRRSDRGRGRRRSPRAACRRGRRHRHADAHARGAPVPPPRKRRRWGAAVFVSIAFGAPHRADRRACSRSPTSATSGKTVPLLDVPKVTSELFPTAEATLVKARASRSSGADTDEHVPPDTVLHAGPGGGAATAQGRHHHARR